MAMMNKIRASQFQVVSALTGLPGIQAVDVVGRNHWKNTEDTMVFTAPCPKNLREFDRWLQAVLNERPDEYDTLRVEGGSLVWRFARVHNVWN